MIPVLFIGLPGSGKTTARHFVYQFLEEKLPGKKIAQYDDYNRLVRLARDQSEKRVILNESYGTFSIEDTERDGLLRELESAILKSAKEDDADVALIELSREDYAPLIGNLRSAGHERAIVFYFKASDDLRAERNQLRGVREPILHIPDQIFLKLFSDNWENCARIHHIAWRTIDNSGRSLSALQREMRLQIEAALQGESTLCIPKRGDNAWKIILVLAGQLLLFGSLLPLFLLLGDISKKDHRLAFSLLISTSSGGLGSVAYGMRCLARYRVQGTLNYFAYKFWYLLRPFQAALLALGVHTILRGGIAVLGSGLDVSKPEALFTIAGISFIVGISTEAAIEWLIELSKKVFTNYRVQPPSSNNK